MCRRRLVSVLGEFHGENGRHNGESGWYFHDAKQIEILLHHLQHELTVFG